MFNTLKRAAEMLPFSIGGNMREYKTTQVIIINDGKVELNKDQARRRKTKIEVIKTPKDDGKIYVNGIYKILKPLMFKVGEVFKWDGTFTKGQLLNDVIDIKADKKKQDADEFAKLEAETAPDPKPLTPKEPIKKQAKDESKN